MAEAITLIVTMALDAAYAQNTEADPPATTTEADRVSAELELGPSVAVDTASLPRVTLGFGLVGSLVLDAWRLEVAAMAWLPRDAEAGPVAASGGSLALYSGALRGCLDILSFAGETLRIGPCVAAEAGAMVGRGYGVANPAGSTNLWSALSSGLSLRFHGLGPIGLSVSAELVVPLRRPVWSIDELPVFQSAKWSARAAFQAVYRFH